MRTEKKERNREVVIRSVLWETVDIPIVGTAPLMCHRVPERVVEELAAKQAGKHQTANPPRDYGREFEEATYRNRENRDDLGHPAQGFKHAIVDAARQTKLKMRLVQQAIEIIPDFFDARGDGLVRLNGKPVSDMRLAPNSKGQGRVPRVRARFDNWTVSLRARFNTTALTIDQVINLIHLAGSGVGVGDGRPGSPKSRGCGWGTWRVAAES